MIDYSKFKRIEVGDLSVRLRVYEVALAYLQSQPKGSVGLCGALFRGCCELSYDGVISNDDSVTVDLHRVLQSFHSPFYHMPMYPEIYKYKRATKFWYPIEDKAIRVRRLRSAIKSINKKIQKQSTSVS